MNRAGTGIWWSPTAEDTIALAVTAAFFTLGGVVGCMLAFRTTDAGVKTMSAYVEGFLSVVKAGKIEVPTFLELLWQNLRWHLLAILFGLSVLGILLIPLLTTVRGFFLAYAIALFARAYGGKGLTLAFLLLGFPALLAVPALFLLSVQSFSTACRLTRGAVKRETSFHREYIFRCAVCVAAVGLGSVIEQYAVPALMTGAVETLF